MAKTEIETDQKVEVVKIEGVSLQVIPQTK
jgi:membrane protein implicated in regulation of membrane protease activity